MNEIINNVSLMMWILAGVLLVAAVVKIYIQRNQWREFFAIYFSGNDGEVRMIVLTGISGATMLLIIGVTIFYQLTT